MSQENVEVVRGAIRSVERGDMDGLRDLHDPEVESCDRRAWPERGAPGREGGAHAVRACARPGMPSPGLIERLPRCWRTESAVVRLARARQGRERSMRRSATGPRSGTADRQRRVSLGPAPRPSKPPGSRSRRCRRRTWRSCGASFDALNRGDGDARPGLASTRTSRSRSSPRRPVEPGPFGGHAESAADVCGDRRQH